MTETPPAEPSTPENDAGPAPLAGAQLIADYVTRLPNAPGVYRMFGANGDVLYVGKARSLKKRVTSYSRLIGHTNRIARMISSTTAMEFVVTESETEALLLEANLIKQLRPRYNVQLRDDKSFPYILIARDHEVPQILKHRGARGRKGDYFGPFASAGAVNRTLNALQKAFLLRSCSDSVYEARTRPCLLYQIKRCSAPCTGEISTGDYDALVAEADSFLTGKSKKIRERMAAQMEQAAGDLDFEKAAIYRDRLRALSHIQAHQGINPQTVEEADVFAIHAEGGQACVQVFFFRAGQNWGNRAYFPKHDKDMETAEILDGFLAQFYEERPAPRLVLLNEVVENADLLAEALTIKRGRKVAVGKPHRGEKRELVQYAFDNAREALGRRLAESSTQTKLLAGLADAFGMDSPPERIEVYDNSHISGTNAVGGMIVAGPEGFRKNQYRKFNIKDPDTEPGDDYAMMREVLTRRFSRLVKDQAALDNAEEGPEDSKATDPPPDWPDLVLIDGGAGQLSIVQSVFDELGIDRVTLVGIAKGPERDAGRERFFMTGREPFMMEPKSPVLYYLQRLRDEAHRFAIGSHRARRKKAIGKSMLDGIASIGPKRKRALLNHFGSARAVASAGLSDLESVEGISTTVARSIYDHFHEGAK
ncbi:MAG: excinuclease ABC subunit UvrC [Candidatus Phaeomarinobacter sp.]